jgi:hypothetical protein
MMIEKHGIRRLQIWSDEVAGRSAAAPAYCLLLSAYLLIGW